MRTMRLDKLTTFFLCLILLGNANSLSYAQEQDKPKKTDNEPPSDIWTKRQVTLDHKDGRSAVIAIWDTGVAISELPKTNVWSNPNESLDGTDSDKNGYLDDLHGIGFGIDEKPDSQLLNPIPKSIPESELDGIARESIGNADLLFSIRSQEAEDTWNRKTKIKKLADKLVWYGEYSHGTHVASVAIEGNPFAEILTIRQQLSHRPPEPKLETYQKRVAAYAEVVQYMKDNSVRVANLSWLRSVGLFENILSRSSKKPPQEREAFARQLYNLERQALEQAIEGAPDILFVTVAGNSTYDGRGSDMAPRDLDLPNILTVGATDPFGEDTELSGDEVEIDIYAHGFNVMSKGPRGEAIRTMGTSMAAPQVTNLAAKLLAVYPNLKVNELRALILDAGTESEISEGVLLLNPVGSFHLAKSRYGN